LLLQDYDLLGRSFYLVSNLMNLIFKHKTPLPETPTKCQNGGIFFIFVGNMVRIALKDRLAPFFLDMFLRLCLYHCKN